MVSATLHGIARAACARVALLHMQCLGAGMLRHGRGGKGDHARGVTSWTYGERCSACMRCAAARLQPRPCSPAQMVPPWRPASAVHCFSFAATIAAGMPAPRWRVHPCM
eukprot:350235-Chlamydomonas_euryale.AAC.12